MKILAITNMYPSAQKPSWGTFVKSQITSLEKAGVKVDVLVIDGGKTKIDYLFAIVAMWIKMYRGNYDLIHAHYGLCGLVAKVQFRLPVIVSFCGDDLYGHANEEGVPTKGSLFWVYLHKRMAKKVQSIIVKSKAMADLIPFVPSHIVPNGVNMEVFKPMNKFECRAKLNLNKHKKIILFPYEKDNVRKNYTGLTKAIALINKHRQEPLELVDVFGVTNNDISLYLNAADIVVVPSYWEGSPNIIKEAMACNTPIVASDVGDVKQVIGNTLGCALCTQDPSSIAEKIIEILSGPEKTNGRSDIQHLDSANVAEKIIEIYSDMLNTTQFDAHKAITNNTQHK